MPQSKLRLVKQKKKLECAFGINEEGFVNLPKKISNIQISRLLYCKKECTYCFPHGFDTRNSTASKNRKNWKYYRMKQWRVIKIFVAPPIDL